MQASGEQVELAFGEQRAVVVGVGAGLRTYSAGGRALYAMPISILLGCKPKDARVPSE